MVLAEVVHQTYDTVNNPKNKSLTLDIIGFSMS